MPHKPGHKAIKPTSSEIESGARGRYNVPHQNPLRFSATLKPLRPTASQLGKAVATSMSEIIKKSQDHTFNPVKSNYPKQP